MMTRAEMIKALQEGVCKVTFTKVNGDKRVMRASLLKEDLENHPTSGNGTSNYDVIPVIDVDKDEWRSFRVDSVETFDKEA